MGVPTIRKSFRSVVASADIDVQKHAGEILIFTVRIPHQSLPIAHVNIEHFDSNARYDATSPGHLVRLIRSPSWRHIAGFRGFPTMDVDQESRSIQREYLDFLDDEVCSRSQLHVAFYSFDRTARRFDVKQQSKGDDSQRREPSNHQHQRSTSKKSETRRPVNEIPREGPHL